MGNVFKAVFSKYDTDKTTPHGNGDVGYEKAYEECFGNIREHVKLIFEIGVNRGGSVRGWKEYFPTAQIVGIEVMPGSYFEEDRIAIEIGSGTDELFVPFLLTKYGHPDIVIDDGSHLSSDIKASFDLLFPNTLFCYVIEDLVTQQSSFEGGMYINDGVPATTIIHKAVDEILLSPQSYRSIRIYHAISFFFK